MASQTWRLAGYLAGVFAVMFLVVVWTSGVGLADGYLSDNVDEIGPDQTTLAEQQNVTSCDDCHDNSASHFQQSEMAGSVTCLDCHDGDQPHNGAAIERTPTAEDCQSCHPTAVEKFGEGKHALGWEAMNTVLESGQRSVPHAVVDEGCGNCHKVGKGGSDELGRSGGRCDVCHTGHEFSTAEANEPEACGSCHAGDHPQYEMWENSKHGKVYQITENESKAPTCQTCHMDDGHGVRTAWGFLGIRGEEPDDAWARDREQVKRIYQWLGPIRAPDVQRSSMDEWEAEREDMVETCSECHTESFAREELQQSDRILRLSDNMTAKAVTVLVRMEEKGAISETEKVQIARQLSKHRFSSFMGSYHKSAKYTWDHGILALQGDMIDLKSRVSSMKRLQPIMENKETIGLLANNSETVDRLMRDEEKLDTMLRQSDDMELLLKYQNEMIWVLEHRAILGAVFIGGMLIAVLSFVLSMRNYFEG